MFATHTGTKLESPQNLLGLGDLQEEHFLREGLPIAGLRTQPWQGSRVQGEGVGGVPRILQAHATGGAGTGRDGGGCSVPAPSACQPRLFGDEGVEAEV